MQEKISAVYKIVNTITGEFYIGSSRNVKSRWVSHKWPSMWKQHLNSKMYQDMQKYGVDKFRFQILAPVMPEYLKQVEQEFIDMLNPTYNNNRANGLDIERVVERKKEYRQSEKCKEYQREYHKEYNKSEKGKEVNSRAQRKYYQTEKGKEVQKKKSKKSYNRFCLYNGETLTFGALAARFKRAGIEHPKIEAKKYLIK